VILVVGSINSSIQPQTTVAKNGTARGEANRNFITIAVSESHLRSSRKYPFPGYAS